MAIDTAAARERIEAMGSELREAIGLRDSQTRTNLIARAIRIRAEVRQMFVDAEHWNDYVRKPGEPRIDPDPDGLLTLILEKLDAGLKGWVQ